MKDKFMSLEYFKEDTPIISKKNNKSVIIIKYYG